MLEEQRISFQMKDYEWLIVSEALDLYVDKHCDTMDLTEIVEFVNHINARVRI